MRLIITVEGQSRALDLTQVQVENIEATRTPDEQQKLSYPLQVLNWAEAALDMDLEAQASEVGV